MKINILGVSIDRVNLFQAVGQVEQWIKQGGKHYIVTPNIEFLMIAQKDPRFKEVLNRANLAIPDSSRFGWILDVLQEKNLLKKLLIWPFFIFPTSPPITRFEHVTGTDLMERLIKEACDWGITVGFLGGGSGVAEKLKECLIKRYPKLQVAYCNEGEAIDKEGDEIGVSRYVIPDMDLLFVAFGAPKQEKWIAKNLEKYPVKVMMGVGGAFDYLSAAVPRAPEFLRNVGFEWLFRLIMQPWRISRFWNLVRFVFGVLTIKR